VKTKGEKESNGKIEKKKHYLISVDYNF
jgi:hypothetical protein